MTPAVSASAGPTERTGAAGSFAVELLLFAVHAERLGRSTLRVELAGPATVATLRAALARDGHAGLLDGHARVAVNQRLVDEGAPIAPGDEVALIPPVAGG